MGLMDKTRALGYSRSAELMADMRNLQGKCRKAVTEWGGGDPETGGGFGAGSGRMVVRAMDTLAATMEGLLARSREEVRGYMRAATKMMWLRYCSVLYVHTCCK